MKILTHIDLDGHCAGAVVAHYENYYNQSDYFEVDYDEFLPIDKIEKDEKVYITDFSFKKHTVWQLEEIYKKTKNIVYCDHHTDTLKLLEQDNYKWINDIAGIREYGISGTALIYMYLYKCKFDECPLFIKHVSDYDCWQFKYEPNTTYFKLGVESYSSHSLDDVWKNLFNDYGYQEIINIGKTIKTYIDITNKYYCDTFGYESEIEGHKCYVVNQKTNSWVFGQKYYEYPLVCIWVFNGKKYLYTLYSSNKDIHCNEIASKFGGGGSTGAAGFSTDNLILLKK